MRVISKFNLDFEMSDKRKLSKQQFDRMAARLLRKISADCAAKGSDPCDPKVEISEGAELLLTELETLSKQLHGTTQ